MMKNLASPKNKTKLIKNKIWSIGGKCRSLLKKQKSKINHTHQVRGKVNYMKVRTK